jgi:hypothetical protein
MALVRNVEIVMQSCLGKPLKKLLHHYSQYFDYFMMQWELTNGFNASISNDFKVFRGSETQQDVVATIDVALLLGMKGSVQRDRRTGSLWLDFSAKLLYEEALLSSTCPHSRMSLCVSSRCFLTIL